MADEKEIDPTSSDDSAALEPRGEELASEHLDEDRDYTAAHDEADAAGATAAEEEIVADPDELAAAEAEVDDMPTTDPEPTSDPQPTPPAATQRSRRPKRRTRSSLIEDAPATDAPVETASDEAASAADGADAAGTATDESLGATAVTASPLRPKRRTAEVAKKDEATPRRTRRTAKADGQHTRNPFRLLARFVQQVIDELRKVVWPNGSQLAQYFVVVLVFVLIIIAIVMGLDLLFGWLLLKLLG